MAQGNTSVWQARDPRAWVAGLQGDLFIEIELAPHLIYTVEGKDISLRVPITPWEAALGAKIEVPTLSGTVMASIPRAAPPANDFVLKGRGCPVKCRRPNPCAASGPAG